MLVSRHKFQCLDISCGIVIFFKLMPQSLLQHYFDCCDIVQLFLQGLFTFVSQHKFQRRDISCGIVLFFKSMSQSLTAAL